MITVIRTELISRARQMLGVVTAFSIGAGARMAQNHSGQDRDAGS